MTRWDMAGPRWWTSVEGRPSYRGPASVPVISPPSACRQRSPLLTTPQSAPASRRHRRSPGVDHRVGDERVDLGARVLRLRVVRPLLGAYEPGVLADMRVLPCSQVEKTMGAVTSRLLQRRRLDVL